MNDLIALILASLAVGTLIHRPPSPKSRTRLISFPPWNKALDCM